MAGNRAKLDTFSINIQRYSQNHAQNGIFGPPYVLYVKFLTQRNLLAAFHPENVSFARKTAN